jgi:peptide/nickel transport system permease protein
MRGRGVAPGAPVRAPVRLRWTGMPGGVCHPALRAVVHRLLLAIPLLLLVSALTFVLVSLTPGDAARQILGVNTTPESYRALQHALGLDLPLHQQYWNWMRSALSGDLGVSVFSHEDVGHALQTRLPVTLSLMLCSLGVSVICGLALGMLSAIRGGVVGRAADVFALLGFALPSFWLGAVLISLFAVRLGWLPASGYVDLSDSFEGWLRSIALPVVALSVGGTAAIAKQTREAMLDVLGSEYVRMARACGLPRRTIYLRHALKNAAVRVVTILGLLAVGLLGGTVMVESIFALPGLGSLAVNATLQHDLPVIQGIVVVFTLVVVLCNLAIDLAYTWLDPRVRTR